jgi:hypothetical protein
MSKALAMLLLGAAVTAQVGCGGYGYGYGCPDYYDGYYGCYVPYGGVYPAYYPPDYLNWYDDGGPIYYDGYGGYGYWDGACCP